MGLDEEDRGREEQLDIVVPGCWSMQVSAGMSWSVSARIQGLIIFG